MFAFSLIFHRFTNRVQIYIVVLHFFLLNNILTFTSQRDNLKNSIRAVLNKIYSCFSSISVCICQPPSAKLKYLSLRIHLKLTEFINLACIFMCKTTNETEVKPQFCSVNARHPTPCDICLFRCIDMMMRFV